MIRVAVVNAKGGTGKTTIATHLAGGLAARGHAVALHDLDRQACALGWLARRDTTAPPIVAVGRKETPPEVAWVIVDAPAGLRRDDLADLVKAVDVLVVPVLPSAFDEAGTASLFAKLADLNRIRRGRVQIGVVANKWDPRRRASTHLGSYLAATGHPVVAHLRDHALYATAAHDGGTVFDYPPSRSRTVAADWSPLFDWLFERFGHEVTRD